MKFYRGTLGKPIVFQESVIITSENLDLIDFDKVVYCEITPIGAMGNEGGILMYVLDKDDLIPYETNILIDEKSYENVSEKINQHRDLFTNYSGGMGNHVYIKKGIQLEIDEEYNCFWYHSEYNTKLRIDSSVTGVFLNIVSEMKNEEKI